MPEPQEDAPVTRSASRIVYSGALIGGLLASGFASGGWVGLATGIRGPGLTTALLLVAIGVGRLVWVWRDPLSLALPESPALRTTAVWGLRMSLVGTIGYIGVLGSGFLLQSLPQDTRGAVGLIVGLTMLPIVTLATLGLVIFEGARGWDLRSKVPLRGRPLLRTAAIIAALATATPWLFATLLRYPGVRPIAELAALGAWPVLALGVGLLIVQTERVSFPVVAVFGTAVVAAVAATMGLTVLGALVQSWQVGAMSGASLINLFVIFAALGGSAAGSILIALPLAITPAIASRMMKGPRSDLKTAQSSTPFIAAAIGMLAVFVLGVIATAPQVAMENARFQATAVSADQSDAQDRFLRRRCASAGTRVVRTVPNVTALEVVFPDPSPPDIKRFPQIPTTPQLGHANDWFPRGVPAVPRYESIVFSFNGKRRGFTHDNGNPGDFRDVDPATIAVRYALKWQRLDAPEEVVAGVAGIEFTVYDHLDDSEIARHTLFFRKVAGFYGYREACGTLPETALLDSYAFKWVSTVLIPRAGPPKAMAQ